MAHLTISSSWYDTENWQSPVHYSEDVGLIPLCLRNGFEATPPMHQHPCAPHPHPCPQPRSSTSEGIQRQHHLLPTTSFAVPGTELRMLIASGCAATSREKPASQLLLRGRGHVLQPACTEVPREGSLCLQYPEETRDGSKNHHTSRSATAWPPRLFAKLKKRWEGETACNNRDKKQTCGEEWGFERDKESFNLSWDPEEMSETEAEIIIQREGKSFRR